MKYYILPMFLVSSTTISSQIDSSASILNISGYAEVYYAYDFNQPEDHNRPAFIYSHNRHNEFNLNLGFIKARYDTKRVRASLALAAGTYMNANYAAEPGVMKNIFEANAGAKLFRNKNLWLEAGIFSSHIGFESAISKDCWGLTRSIAAENSPYYEAGAKLTYISEDSKWLLSGLLLNGWQHIYRPDGNNSPAFGTQITYIPNENITINYSTFIGNDKPDTSKQMRYFNNLYGMLHLTEHLHLTAGLDYGLEQKSEGSSEYNHWFSPILIVKVIFNKIWSVTGRAEYYADEKEVIISTGTEHGFQTFGYSLNVDFQIRENTMWRVEGRLFSSKDEIFSNQGEVTKNNVAFNSSFAVSF